MEASFLGGENSHFSSSDLEDTGREFCLALLDLHERRRDRFNLEAFTVEKDCLDGGSDSDPSGDELDDEDLEKAFLESRISLSRRSHIGTPTDKDSGLDDTKKEKKGNRSFSRKGSALASEQTVSSFIRQKLTAEALSSRKLQRTLNCVYAANVMSSGQQGAGNQNQFVLVKAKTEAVSVGPPSTSSARMVPKERQRRTYLKSVRRVTPDGTLDVKHIQESRPATTTGAEFTAPKAESSSSTLPGKPASSVSLEQKANDASLRHIEEDKVEKAGKRFQGLERSGCDSSASLSSSLDGTAKTESAGKKFYFSHALLTSAVLDLIPLQVLTAPEVALDPRAMSLPSLDYRQIKTAVSLRAAEEGMKKSSRQSLGNSHPPRSRSYAVWSSSSPQRATG